MTSSLGAAIDRARRTKHTGRPVHSPLRALGRRRLGTVDLLGQSLSTIAPATGMIYVALWMATYRPGMVGLMTIAATTAVVALVASCISQFTRRCAAAGSLYSFVFQGLGPRATLTTGTALLLAYIGILISVLGHCAESVLGIVGLVLGRDVGGGSWIVCAALLVVLGGAITIGGVRFATRAILVTEVSSLVLISVLLALGKSSDPTVAMPHADSGLGVLPFLAMTTVLSMAGFESAAFFGSEVRCPLVDVTRVVLMSPVITGVLFVLAAGAALSGKASLLLNAYFSGPEAGLPLEVVLGLRVGLACSWFACTLGCVQAGSRLLYSMGVEHVLPRALSRVHRHRRTPWVAVASVEVAGLVGACLHRALTSHVSQDPFWSIVEIALVAAYTLVALAAWSFLSRIKEQTTGTAITSLVVAGSGLFVLVWAAVDGVRHHVWVLTVAVALIGLSGTLWYALVHRIRPANLHQLGAFDTVETADILPGAGELVLDEDGRRRIVAAADAPRGAA